MAPRPFVYFLKWVAQYHKALQLHYLHESLERHRPEVNALLAYLAQNEGVLARLIETYEHDAPDALLNAWFKISPSLAHVEPPDQIHFDPDASVSDVIDRVLDVDESLIELYKMLLRQTNSAEMHDALEALINEELREEVRLVACDE